jgi:recombination protein U
VEALGQIVRDNVKIGRIKQAVGEMFEAWVDGQHEHAQRLGIIAHVEKNEPHSKIIHGHVIYTAAGVADRTGTLEGGRSLAVECKSTKAVRFPRNDISTKQQEHLDAVARAGGLALLLVEFRATTPPLFARYAIPWLEIPWKTLKTAESLDPADIGVWMIPPGVCYLSRWHAGGPRSSQAQTRRRVLARE